MLVETEEISPGNKSLGLNGGGSRLFEGKETGLVLGTLSLYSFELILKEGRGYREVKVGKFFTCDVVVLLFECIPIFVNLRDITQSVLVVFYCGGRIHDLSDERFFPNGTHHGSHGLFVGRGSSIGQQSL